MIHTELLQGQFNGHIQIAPISKGVYQIKAPFFHEDGDMMDIYLEETGDSFRLCDYGTSLMRLSYTFDIDTDNKERIFHKILTSNGVASESGNIVLPSSYETFFNDLMQYQVAISKITNLDVLKREQVASLFMEQLSVFVSDVLGNTFHNIKPHYEPTSESYFVVDYAILDNPNRPVYILGIKDNLQAARASALCLRLANLQTHHTSIAVHENQDSLSSRDRNALTNAVDKQYTSLLDFEQNGRNFISRQVVA